MCLQMGDLSALEELKESHWCSRELGRVAGDKHSRVGSKEYIEISLHERTIEKQRARVILFFLKNALCAVCRMGLKRTRVNVWKAVN